MSTTKRPPPALTEYQINRDQFTDEQLTPYDGQWVAFSSDCTRIVAGAPDLSDVHRLVSEAGEDPNCVWFEFIDFSPDIWLGGAEFG